MIRLTRFVLGGGLVVLAAPVQSQAPPTWQITRDLRIDAIEQDLAPIDWLLVSSTGTMVVSQPQDTLLILFDARGRRLGTFGRGGEGPGEFRRMVRAGWMADTLWVSDVQQRRVTFITPDRKLARTQLHLPTVNLNGKAVDSVMTMLGAVPYALFADGRMVVSVLEMSETRTQWPGGVAGTTAYIHVNGSGDFLNVMGTQARSSCSVSYRFDKGNGSVAIPFCGRPMSGLAADGSRFLSVAVEEQTARTVAYRVTVTRTTGDTLFSRRYTAPTVAIPRDLAEERLNAASSRPNPFPGANEAMEKALAGVKVPPVFPPYSRALVGRDDTIWIELYRRDEPRTWQVLDGQGNPVARVNVPWNVEIQIASRTTIWGVETDDDGLEHIVRYRVSR
jgi:hypothetical protein